MSQAKQISNRERQRRARAAMQQAAAQTVLADKARAVLVAVLAQLNGSVTVDTHVLLQVAEGLNDGLTYQTTLVDDTMIVTLLAPPIGETVNG